MDGGLGTTRWAIPVGWIAALGERKGGRALESPEAECLVNAADADAPYAAG